MKTHHAIKCIAEGKLEEAIDAMISIVKEFGKIELELYQQKSRLNSNKSHLLAGEIHEAESNLHTAQICHAVLEQVHDLEQYIRELYEDKQPDSSERTPFQQRLANSLRFTYELGDIITDGNAAILVKAKDILSTREVAIKCLKSQDTDIPSNAVREEVNKILQIKHRHILKLIGDYLHNDPPSLALEYIDGIDLAHRTTICGPCTTSEVADIMEKMTRAVYYLHKKGLQKNNLHASRVFLDEEEEPVMSPFELLKMNTNWRSLQQFAESLRYMAPEQIPHPDQGATGSAAQFSLGLLTYFLLTGEELFEGQDFLEVFNSRRRFFSDRAYHTAQFNKLTKESKTTPALIQILRTALQELPEKRYPTLRTMAEQFRQAQRPLPDVYFNMREEYANCLSHNPNFFKDILQALSGKITMPHNQGVRRAAEDVWFIRDFFQYLMALPATGACPIKIHIWTKQRGITPEVLERIQIVLDQQLAKANLQRENTTIQAWQHQWALLGKEIDI